MARIAIIAGIAALGAVTGGLAAAGFGIFAGTFAGGSILAGIGLGGSLGLSAGELVSSLVVHPTVDGPRLSDSQVSGSANGAPIPFGYGGFRMAAQIIWSSGIIETATDQSQSSKGIGSPTTLTYTYTISFAAAFCQGPASVTRIWGDSKLIYDSTSKGAVTSDTFDTGLQNTGKGESGGQTTVVIPIIYPGNETQDPDPTIQAAEGIDQTPAFRNICYALYNNLPLADFGNRLPNIRGEIATATTDSFVKDTYVPINLAIPTVGGGGTTIYNPTFCYVDTLDRVAFIVDSEGRTAERIDLATTNTEPLQAWQASTPTPLGTQILDNVGNVQTATSVSGDTKTGSTQPVWTPGGETETTSDNNVTWTNTGPGPDAILITAKGILNPFLESGETFTGGFANNLPLGGGIDTRGHFWASFQITKSSSAQEYAVQFDSSTMVAINRVAIPSPVLAMSFAQINGEDLVYITTEYGFSGGAMLYVIRSKGASMKASGSWIPSTDPVSSTNGPVYPTVDPATGICYIVTFPGGGSPWEWNVTVFDPRSGAAEPSSFQFHGDSTHGTGVVAMFDPIDDTLIVFTDNGSLYKVRVSDMTVVASAASVVGNTGNGVYNYPKWNLGTVPSVGLFIALDSSDNLLYIDHSTLAVQSTIAEQEWFAATLGGNFKDAQLDPITLSLVCTPPGGGGNYSTFSFRIYLNRQEVASETLDSIVSDLCGRAGLTSDLIDVSALSSLSVLGYAITRNSDVKSCLVPLVAAFFFDAVESDFVLKFVPRGGAVAMSIPEDDLGLDSDKYKLVETISQEHDLPKAIEVLYSDPTLDYQNGKQRKARPARVVKTKTKTVLELPLTMEADTAAQIAAKYLQTIWNERNQYDYKLISPKYLVLDPTDVVEFTYEGDTFVERLIKGTIGQDLVSDFSGCSEDPASYVSSATGSSGSGFPPQTLNPAAPTTLYIMDLPLLADTDNPPPGTSGYYFAMASAAPGWPGGVLYNSPDDQNFTQVGFAQSAIQYGSVGPATPAPAGASGPWVIDLTTQITVRVFGGGTLSSTSLINLLNGANAFVLGEELIQFQTATLNADGSYTLSNLLRGRRGTEWAASQHVTGEVALFLPSGLHRNNVPVSLVGLTQYYQAVTIKQQRNLANSQTITLQGNDLKPYAPCHITGSRDGSNNLTTDWFRRTRIGGDADWLDGVTDVPLSEVSEAYSVDILVSGIVVRTFNGLTSPTAVYSAADQTADGITPGDPVNVNIFQISASVGRGFAGVATV
jgi:hypothetical protein